MSDKMPFRYRGHCPRCDRTVQSTPRFYQTSNPPRIYVRCRGCDHVVECDRKGLASALGETNE